MLEYHAAYHKTDDGWYVGEVVDFPGVFGKGQTLRSAQRRIRSALRFMAECLIEEGQVLPRPNPRARAKKVVFFEVIPLRVRTQTGGVV